MRIPQATLVEFVDEATFHKVRLHAVSRAVGIVGKYYCDRMTRGTTCPLKCGECKATLIGMFARIDPKTTKNSYALLTWLSKTAAANAADKQSLSRTTGPAKNWLGEAEERDPFDVLGETYGG